MFSPDRGYRRCLTWCGSLRPRLLGTRHLEPKNKVGLGIAIVYAITNIPSAFVPPGTGTEDGPPMAILWVCTVLSVGATVAGIVAWRSGSRPAAASPQPA